MQSKSINLEEVCRTKLLLIFTALLEVFNNIITTGKRGRKCPSDNNSVNKKNTIWLVQIAEFKAHFVVQKRGKYKNQFEIDLRNASKLMLISIYFCIQNENHQHYSKISNLLQNSHRPNI